MIPKVGFVSVSLFFSSIIFTCIYRRLSCQIKIPFQVRKGKVGARLPSEPWDIDESNESNSSIVSDDPAPHKPSDYNASAPPCDRDPPDFAHNLNFETDSDGDLLDFYSESEPEIDPPAQSHSYKIHRTDGVGRFLTARLDDNDRGIAPYLAASPSSLPPLTRSTSSNSSSSSRMTSPSLGPQTPWSSIDETQTFSMKKISDQVSYLPPLDDDQESFTEYVPPPDARSNRRWVIPHADWMVPGSPDRTPTSTMFAALDLLLSESSEGPHVPSTSAGTIRSPIHNAVNGTRTNGRSDSSQGEMVDGSGWDHRQNSNGRAQPNSWESSLASGNGASGSASHGSGSGDGHGNHPGSGSGGDDGGDRRRPNNYRSAFSTPTESEESVEESEDTSTDDYGQESPSMLHHPSSFSRSRSEQPPSQDDDIPLAQRIPTALDAQRTIQKQVQDEREQRRRERALRRQLQESEPTRPVIAVDLLGMSGAQQEAALHTPQSSKRPRTKTLPSNLISPTTFMDLTKRLLKVQDSTLPHRARRDEPPTKPLATKFPLGSSRNVPVTPTQEEDRDLRLKHARSFHNLLRRDAPDAHNGRGYGESKSVHSGKLLTFPGGDDMLGFNRLLKTQKSNEEGQRFGGGIFGSRPNTSSGRPSGGSVGRSTSSVSRPSTSAGRLTTGGGMGRSQTTSVGRPSTSGGRPSLGDELTPSRISVDHQQQNAHRPPLPSFRGIDGTTSPVSPLTAKVQQRIFIGDMQSFHMVEIGASTSAGDVLRIVEAQGALGPQGAGTAWMLWEMAQDFGMGEC